MKRLIALIIAFAFTVSLHLPAYAATVTKPAPAAPMLDPLAWIKQFSAADLQAALDDANAQNPKSIVSIPCWTFLLGLVNGTNANSLLPAKPGIFAAIQKAIDDQQLLVNWLSPNGTLDQLNVACSPLIQKVNANLVVGGAAIAAVAASGPAGIAGAGSLLTGLKALLGGATLLPALKL